MKGLEFLHLNRHLTETSGRRARKKSVPFMLMLVLAFLPAWVTPLSAKTPSGTFVTNTVVARYSNGFSGFWITNRSAVVNHIGDYSMFSASATNSTASLAAVTYVPFHVTSSNNYTDIFTILPMTNSVASVTTRVYSDLNGNGLVDGGDALLTNSGPVAEGGILNLILAVQVPSSATAGTTNRTVLMIRSSRTNSMTSSHILFTNFQTLVSAVSNTVQVLSANDGYSIITLLNGSQSLARGDTLITAAFGNPPKNTNSIRLWYDVNRDPDGTSGPSASDRSVAVTWNGQTWQAVIPRSDAAIIDGVQVRFAIELDGIVYLNGSQPWMYLIHDRPDQGSGFNVFPTILDLRQQSVLNIFYKVPKQGKVSIRIYDLKGDLVRSMEEGTKDPGEYGPIYWDGKNHSGQTVAVGLYFVTIRGKDLDETRKIILVK